MTRATPPSTPPATPPANRSSWADLRGRRVGVWGVGVEGRATLRRLEHDAVTPTAVVETTDAAGLAELLRCEVVVKSPGISPYEPPARALLDAGVEIVGGLGLWLAGAPGDRVLAVTGTKGKSTTASVAGALAGELLAPLGERVLVGGNLGSPPWDPDLPAADWYVVEVSSYQAHDVRIGPSVVAVTSLSQDHLVWHGGYPRYVADKLSLATRPGVRRVLATADDVELRAHAELLGPQVTWVPSSQEPWLAGLGLLGEHNARNALLARAALVALGLPGAEDDGAVAAAASAYQPLPSRLTSLGVVDGVDFIDDSLATNVLPTLAAVDSFPARRVALLVGGQDRGIDYRPLGLGLAARASGACAVLVLTLPDCGPRIAAAVRAAAPELEVRECADLAAATRAGFEWALPDGVVLLSPAAPSFGVFRDYAERAAVFGAAMEAL